MSGVYLPYGGAVAFAGAMISGFIIIIRLFRLKRIEIYLALFLFFIFHLLISSLIYPAFPKNHIINYANSRDNFKISGKVVSKPKIAGNALRFILDVETIQKDAGNKVFATGLLPVKSWDRYADINEGDIISFRGKIRRIRNFYNPGYFDYERFMAFKKIFVSSYVHSGTLVTVKKSYSRGVITIDVLREKISDIIDMLPEKMEKEKQLLKALTIGYKDDLSDDIRSDFAKAGAGHILAISGLHIGIVAAASFIFFSYVFSFFNIMLKNAWVKKSASSITIVISLIYANIAGMSPSTQRAVIMISVFLGAFIIEKEQDSLNTLFIAGVIILLIKPDSLFSVSFQLSFAAVFFIICGLNKFFKDEHFADYTNTFIKIRRKIYAFFLTSIFAILGTAPIIMYHFHKISFMGIFTNFFIIPIIGFLTIPISFLAVLISPLSVNISLFIFKVAVFFLSIGLKFIEAAALVPFAEFSTFIPNIIEIIFFYILFLSILYIKKDYAKIIALFSVILLFIDAGYWTYKRFITSNMQVTVLDVGQGSAALIEAPKGYTMLIDGGGFYDNSSFDVGKLILAPFLLKKKIKTIDTIVSSHPDSDHLNGLIYIAENFNVKNFLSNNQKADAAGYKTLLKAIREKNIKNEDFENIKKEFFINGVKIEILYPPLDFENRSLKEIWRDFNNNSLVLRIEYGAFSFLFPGDIKAEAEKELVHLKKDALKTYVLAVPHHGSRSSSIKSFIDAVNPEYAVISSGAYNRFGFPHLEVVKRYEKKGCYILNTSRNGAVIFTTDGKNFKAAAQKWK